MCLYICGSIPSPDRIALGDSSGTGGRQLGSADKREMDFRLPRTIAMGAAFEMAQLPLFGEGGW